MIGERLAEIRKDHGDTQADLAAHLGVSLPTIRAWEQEKSSPSHEMLVHICRHYCISSDYLLGLSDEDFAYTRHLRQSRFSREEIVRIHEYERFLLWKRHHSRKT